MKKYDIHIESKSHTSAGTSNAQGANAPPQFFFHNLFSLFVRGIQLERKICTLKTHKFYIIMSKCPLTSISSSAFVKFKVILFIFDFLHGYVLFPKILKKNQRKKNKR